MIFFLIFFWAAAASQNVREPSQDLKANDTRRAADLSTRIETLKARFAEMKHNYDGRYDYLENLVKKLEKENEEAIDDISEKLEKDEETIAGISEKITKTEAAIAGVSGEITKTKEQIDALKNEKDREEQHEQQCEDLKCTDHGQCLEGSNGAECQCHPGYFGERCEKGCCRKSDCSDYRGELNQTKHGRPCQPWNVDRPHRRNPKLTPAAKPDSGLDSNFCRNPEAGLEATGWCYTMDPLMRFEDCNLPMCDNLAATPSTAESDRETAKDVKVLYRALKGGGTTESDIIKILAFRTHAERIKIKNLFYEENNDRLGYKYSLFNWLWEDLGGWFRTTMIALMYTSESQYLNKEVKAAVESGSTKLVFDQAICASSNDLIMRMKKDFENMAKQVTKHIKIEEADYRNLLTAIFEGNRGGDSFSPSVAEADEKELVESPTSDALIRILTTRGRSQLQQTFRDMDIEAIIEKTSATPLFKMCAKTLAQTAKYQPPYYWAGVIHEAVSPSGTDEASLIRAIVSRFQIDMNQIKRSYEMRFSRSLAGDVVADTSGDFRAALLALLREWPGTAKADQ